MTVTGSSVLFGLLASDAVIARECAAFYGAPVPAAATATADVNPELDTPAWRADVSPWDTFAECMSGSITPKPKKKQEGDAAPSERAAPLPEMATLLFPAQTIPAIVDYSHARSAGDVPVASPAMGISTATGGSSCLQATSEVIVPVTEVVPATEAVTATDVTQQPQPVDHAVKRFETAGTLETQPFSKKDTPELPEESIELPLAQPALQDAEARPIVQPDQKEEPPPSSPRVKPEQEHQKRTPDLAQPPDESRKVPEESPKAQEPGQVIVSPLAVQAAPASTNSSASSTEIRADLQVAMPDCPAPNSSAPNIRVGREQPVRDSNAQLAFELRLRPVVEARPASVEQPSRPLEALLESEGAVERDPETSPQPTNEPRAAGTATKTTDAPAPNTSRPRPMLESNDSGKPGLAEAVSRNREAGSHDANGRRGQNNSHTRAELASQERPEAPRRTERSLHSFSASLLEVAPEANVRAAAEPGEPARQAHASAIAHEMPSMVERKTPVTNLHLQIEGPEGRPVDIHFHDSEGKLHLAVHTQDANYNEALREQVGELLSGLERQGFHADTAAEPIRDIADSQTTSNQEGSSHRQQSHDDAPSGQRQRQQNPEERQNLPWKQSSRRQAGAGWQGLFANALAGSDSNAGKE